MYFCLTTASTLYGPLHTKQAVDQYLAAIEQAKKQGGTLVCGGKVQCCTFKLCLLHGNRFGKLNFDGPAIYV